VGVWSSLDFLRWVGFIGNATAEDVSVSDGYRPPSGRHVLYLSDVCSILRRIGMLFVRALQCAVNLVAKKFVLQLESSIEREETNLCDKVMNLALCTLLLTLLVAFMAKCRCNMNDFQVRTRTS